MTGCAILHCRRKRIWAWRPCSQSFLPSRMNWTAMLRRVWISRRRLEKGQSGKRRKRTGYALLSIYFYSAWKTSTDSSLFSVDWLIDSVKCSLLCSASFVDCLIVWFILDIFSFWLSFFFFPSGKWKAPEWAWNLLSPGNSNLMQSEWKKIKFYVRRLLLKDSQVSRSATECLFLYLNYDFNGHFSFFNAICVISSIVGRQMFEKDANLDMSDQQFMEEGNRPEELVHLLSKTDPVFVAKLTCMYFFSKFYKNLKTVRIFSHIIYKFFWEKIEISKKFLRKKVFVPNFLCLSLVSSVFLLCLITFVNPLNIPFFCSGDEAVDIDEREGEGLDDEFDRELFERELMNEADDSD